MDDTERLRLHITLHLLSKQGLVFEFLAASPLVAVRRTTSAIATRIDAVRRGRGPSRKATAVDKLTVSGTVSRAGRLSMFKIMSRSSTRGDLSFRP